MAKWEENEIADRFQSYENQIDIPVERINKKQETDHEQLSFKENKNTLSILKENLGHCLQIIDDEVMKGYVTKLEMLPIVKYKKSEEIMSDVQLFKITELVYQDNEFSVHKLSTVFHVLSNRPCTVILMLKSDGDKCDFYLGVKSLSSFFSTGRMRDMLENSLKGMFPGSKIEPYFDDEMRQYMRHVQENKNGKYGSVSCVTCVADYKQNKEHLKNKEFIQGLEKFVQSMNGKAYTAILLADSVSHDELCAIKSEYESIYTQISPFSNMQLNFSSNTGKSLSAGISTGQSYTHNYGEAEGVSVSIAQTQTTGSSKSYSSTDTNGTNESSSEGETKTVGHTEGVNNSYSDAHTDGNFNSASVTVGVGVRINQSVSATHGNSSSDTYSVSHGTNQSDSVSNSISKTLAHGISEAHSDTNAFSDSNSESRTIGDSTQNTYSYNIGETFNFVDTETLTHSFGASQGVTLNSQNRMLLSTMSRIATQLERIEECESKGMWRFASYFIAESSAETETAANMYKSIMAGNKTGLERSAVNTWSNEGNRNDLIEYLTDFCHPIFEYSGFSYEQKRVLEINPTSLVSTDELAIHMGLPRYSVKGLPVVEHAIFAQEVICKEDHLENDIFLGNIYHLGKNMNTNVCLDSKSLSMHTFITGSTGSGKSNTVYHILTELQKKKIPFLVVEPAKGEYKSIFKDVNCFGTNPLLGKMVRINPFAFPNKVHVLEHIDRLIEIFNVCWPMYAAMPAVLKESIEKAYQSAGWDLDLSINVKVDGLFPTFDDVLRELNDTINMSEYSADTKGDYIGSLSTRIKSLTNGINGKIFAGQEMDLCDLFDESAILDISRVGSMETKSLIMGLVVLKLQEYRMTNAIGMNVPLKHVTVLEEAHNILKKTSLQQSAESVNLQGKSVEMLSNVIAEIRTFGEGFVIVDQAPDLLDTAAIRNTNTKIVMRLPENNDRQLVGKSMALGDEQMIELAKLPTGVAAVYQNHWQESVLCKIPEYVNSDMIPRNEPVSNQYVLSREFYDGLLHDLLLVKENNTDEVRNKILKSNVSAKIKLDLIQNINSRNLTYEWAVADFIKKNYEYSNVFKGTQSGNWKNLDELVNIMEQNIVTQFEDFTKEELRQILYYMCRIYHELFPNNTVIEQVRTECLKEGII